MSISPKLMLRQGQSLVMTPQLLQAIKLLQLSSLDLQAYVEEELERNPLLERDEAADSSSVSTGAEESLAPMEGAAEMTMADGAIVEAVDANLADVFPEDPGAEESIPSPPTEGWAEAPSRQSLSREEFHLDEMLSEKKTLGDHLCDQLGLASKDPLTRIIGRTLIDAVDASGYMRADLGEMAEQLGAPLAEVKRVLELIQTFDPAGICARDLAECLSIQLRERDRLDPAMAALLLHLDLVARRDFAALQRICGVDADDLADMLAEIKRLNPRPGSAFGDSAVQPVVPDILLRTAPDGSWLIELNSQTLPRVLVQQNYYATIARRAQGAADKSYLADCLQSANWLVKSLDQRARTILKVASEIVRQQDAFFAHGVQHLRPLNLKSIAEAISMHESTVSRVTSNKYIATARGTFELKYFFTASIAASGGGEAHSAEAVRHRIKLMIEREAEDAVLSDDTIVEALRGDGVDIARRTVAKYREALRIPSSVQRRREKQGARTLATGPDRPDRRERPDWAP